MTNPTVQDQFGPGAHHYATCEVHASGESLDRLVHLTNPQKSWHALDIATGAGHTAALFAPHVKSVIATDVTPQMLAETQKLKASRNLENLTTAFADAAQLPYPDNEFDLVTCRLAAHHFPDPQAFVSECARVLKPGGTFALNDNIPPDTRSLPDATPVQIENAAIDYNIFEALRDPSHARALSANEWTRLATQYGLTVSAREVLTKEMEFDAWVKRMRCSETTITQLHQTLSDNTALANFLMPREVDDKLCFSLRELILIARKKSQRGHASLT